MQSYFRFIITYGEYKQTSKNYSPHNQFGNEKRNMGEILHDIYFNPEQPGAFTVPNKLSKAAQNLGYDVSKFKAEKWL